MIFYYIRHADPIYNPDSITEHGKAQADALAYKLCKMKINKIFTSSSNRAIMTAEPTCKKLHLEHTVLDWASEDKAATEFCITVDGKLRWCFMDQSILEHFNSAEVRGLGDKWYNHQCFNEYCFKYGIKRINNETDKFFAELGYEHDRENHTYNAKKPNEDRIAFFAHGGFGMAFLSSILDIPYSSFCLHFEQLGTSCITVINFTDNQGIVLPKILEYCDNSHLFKSELPPYHHVDF